MRPRSTPPLWNRPETLVLYVVTVSVLGATFTMLLDKLADSVGAPPMLHGFVIHGSAAVFALAAVMLYAGRRQR